MKVLAESREVSTAVEADDETSGMEAEEFCAVCIVKETGTSVPVVDSKVVAEVFDADN